MKERLQKILARAGAGSRRQIEQWIAAGQVTLNGTVAKLGDQADANDRVTLRGRQIKMHQSDKRVIVYHKQVGEVTTRKDPRGRPTVFESLPRLRSGRWISIGRLDISTSGLLLFTDDGELAHRLMHPSSECQREYAVRVFGKVDEDILSRLQKGVQLDDGPARFLSIRDAGGSGANHWYNVVLAEGRNREVKRLWSSQDIIVSRLIRIRYGPITLDRRLQPGRWYELESSKVAQLYNLVNVKKRSAQRTSSRS